jgi:L-threonylcarbamoyladenylate synthase
MPLGREGHLVRSRSIKRGDCTILRVPDLKRYDLRTRDLTDVLEREAARLLEGGALMVYPTDTLYAIGCRALDGETVAALRRAKGREAAKALPVIVADLAQARSIASSWPAAADRLAAVFWPGPLTLVVPASPTLPAALLAGADNVAVRVPDSKVARALARIAGPLVSTSANLASEPPCVTVDEALAAFPQAMLAFDVGPLEGEPSTIVTASDLEGDVRVLRAGKVSASAIEAALGARLSRG